jgi:hypothetical protein
MRERPLSFLPTELPHVGMRRACQIAFSSNARRVAYAADEREMCIRAPRLTASKVVAVRCLFYIVTAMAIGDEIPF